MTKFNRKLTIAFLLFWIIYFLTYCLRKLLLGIFKTYQTFIIKNYDTFLTPYFEIAVCFCDPLCEQNLNENKIKAILKKGANVWNS